VRDMFFKKHSIYVFIFIFIWVATLANNYFVMTHPKKNNSINLSGSAYTEFIENAQNMYSNQIG